MSREKPMVIQQQRHWTFSILLRLSTAFKIPQQVSTTKVWVM